MEEGRASRVADSGCSAPAVPRPSPSAAGRTPTRGWLAAAGRPNRVLQRGAHQAAAAGWRGGDGGREGGKEVPGPTGRSGALGAREIAAAGAPSPAPARDAPGPPGDTRSALHLGSVRPALP